MNATIKAALCASLCLAMAACGRSSSNSNDNTQLKTDNDDLFNYCQENPYSSACENLREEGGNLGFEDYFGGNGYSDDDYDGAGGFCGCENNNSRPVLYGGGTYAERFCEPSAVSSGRRSQGRRIYMRYSKRGKKDKLTVRYDHFSGNQSETWVGNNGGACPQYAEVRCSNSSMCNATGIPGACVPISGRDYGYCEERNPYRY